MSSLWNRRQTVIFTVGTLINIIFFLLARYTSFPIWLDFSGSMYITLLLGTAAGIVSVIAQVILSAVLMSGTGALSLLPIMLTICIIIGFLAQNRFLDGFYLSLAVVLITTILGIIITFLVSLAFKNVMPGYLEWQSAFDALHLKTGPVFARIFFAVGTKFTELTLCWCIVGICALITPKQRIKIGFSNKR